MTDQTEGALEPEENNPESDPEKEKQSARCLLRERFLRTVTGVVGKECSFQMYSNNNIEGIFRGCDIEFENLLVEKLKTPFAEIPHAKIRSSDVNYMVFNAFLNFDLLKTS